ncbi:MAG: hypothetical protein LBI05_04485 [Planctomycetaceae bacterium]|jgi:hypothetical protein|nr:hypothetical protein [Planctomycetaceae bacterium]
MRPFHLFIAVGLFLCLSSGYGHAQKPDKPETLDGLLENLCDQFDSKKVEPNLTMHSEDGLMFSDGAFYGLAGAIAKFDDPKAIPYLIGAIDADNTYATIYGIGWFGLKDLTGVEFNVFHDGAFWRQWWENNKNKFPENVQSIKIPDLPKTAKRVSLNFPPLIF